MSSVAELLLVKDMLAKGGKPTYRRKRKPARKLKKGFRRYAPLKATAELNGKICKNYGKRGWKCTKKLWYWKRYNDSNMGPYWVKVPKDGVEVYFDAKGYQRFRKLNWKYKPTMWAGQDLPEQFPSRNPDAYTQMLEVST